MKARRAWLMLGWGVVLLTVVDGLMLSFDPQYQPSHNSDKNNDDNKRTYGPVIPIIRGAIADTEEFIEAHEKLLVVLSTIAIAWFTATLWRATSGLQTLAAQQAVDMSTSLCIARDAANAATKSAKVAEDALLIGERPYIFITNAWFSEPLSRKTFDYESTQDALAVIYKVENHGRTPAVVTAICAESICEKTLPQTPDYRDNRIYDELRSVYPAGHKEVRSFYLKTPIDGQAMSDIGIRTRNLFLFGFVRYEDIFDQINTVGFCWRYNLDLEKFLPEENPAYNYRKGEPKPLL